MSGLVDYGSSDEEAPAPSIKESKAPSRIQDDSALAQGTISSVQANGAKASHSSQPLPTLSITTPKIEIQSQTSSATPSSVVDVSTQPAQLPMAGPQQTEFSANSAPSSPYTTTRQLTHSLTLPPLPNVAIPPSPPGSPSILASKKITRFLALKSQGVHFNEKLASSAQLRNPSLLQNLMEFAGIDEKHGQYATTLEEESKPVPSKGYPEWAFAEMLNKAQLDTGKKKLNEREAVDFVPSGIASRDRSAAGTPSGATSGTEISSTRTKSRFDAKERSPKRRRER